MVCSSNATLALHCPRCGNIQMHEFSRFTIRQMHRQRLVCSCGHVQAVVASTCRRQYLFEIPCIVCGTSHIVAIDGKRFWRAKADKIYCVQANLELGLIGDRRQIEETIRCDGAEFANLLGSDEGETIKNPPVMFQIFNLVHDLAARGGIHCQCTNAVLEADILADRIVLKCINCGARQVIDAGSQADLEHANAMAAIELTRQRRRRRHKAGSRRSSEEVLK
ncbi:hypothetical protein TcarDRAFT_0980 [Thermosinus carboxydivorans Nor1]|uniref:Uncharacterized protein n=1 Tax=Thermosinus carboxydivorans Nor1 TaxID=401526 RepID=A1HRX0_9FIRM|nr:hypothetical protein [Thermosinus carboxydivorans]EAX47291.1 hypothetical protein TcarDRAFT_0980 [Thermosinus carboxydivorans Nor1]